MSQEKVNKYKEYKAHKKEILAKEKKKKFLTKIALYIAGIVIVGGIAVAIGITVRNEYRAYLASKPNYDASSLVISDMAGVLEEEETSAAEE